MSDCPTCGKADYDTPAGCSRPAVFSPAVGDWCCLAVSPEKIRADRQAAGLTQAEAARLVHYEIRAYRRLEHGERTIHPAIVELLYRKLPK